MTIAELLGFRAKARPDDPAKERETRRAVRIDELGEEWVTALKNADYSHLPSRKDKPPMR